MLHKEVMRQSGATMLKISFLQLSASNNLCRQLLGEGLQRYVYDNTHSLGVSQLEKKVHVFFPLLF